MARGGIVVGLILCGLTLVALVGNPIKSPTHFIPMMFGIPVLFCGVVALNPHRRKQAMHFASAVGLIGAIGGLVRVAYCLIRIAGGNEVSRYDLTVIAAMSAICIVFVILCVISFIQARRRMAVGGSERARGSIGIADSSTTQDRLPDVKPRESA